MTKPLDKSELDAIFRPPSAVRNSEEKLLPRVAEALERNRKARAAVARGESLADLEIKDRFGEKALDLLRKLPSKAVLEKRFPRLALNRLTHRWRDDATGEHGDSLESLIAYLDRPRKRRAD
jgi:hypothetical protein